MNSDAVSPLRRSLWPLAFVYGAGMALRNAAYDRGWRPTHALPVPVVSVGNLTVGGTGKTPLVLWLVAEALRRGRRPGVLARGYGRAPGAALNDEGELIAARFPGLPQVQMPDRVAGGRVLVERHGVDLVVLDDGFQHRRIARDRDLLCLDARRPFAQGALLPAGDLRESARAGLRRADVVVLTRADRLGGDDVIGARAAQLREYARRDLPVLACRHRPVEVAGLQSEVREDAGALRGRRVLLVSAIARPGAFRETVASLGAEIVGEVARRDHHRYGEREVAELAGRAAAADAMLLTTEKDAAKLRAFELDARFLRVELEWLGAVPAPEQVGIA